MAMGVVVLLLPAARGEGGRRPDEGTYSLLLPLLDPRPLLELNPLLLLLDSELSLDDELPLPERRLGSFSHFSERPMFWPKSASEPRFTFPCFEDVSRLMLPPDDELVFLLILSRSRFSIASSFINVAARRWPRQLFEVQWRCLLLQPENH
jgi:hypothetical protein